jgi:predicted permease
MIVAIRETLSRLRSLFRRRELDADLDAELAAHLEMSIADNLRQGMSPEEARRRALVRLGGIEQAKELHRDSRGLPWLEAFFQDVRYALRGLRRDAGLAAFAVLIVGLGVGASSTVFSVVNALLLRPLPFDDPGRLVWIRNGDAEDESDRTVQVAYLQQLQTESRLFADVAGFSPFADGDHHLTSPGDPERLTGVPVTANFFGLLGVQPQLGRLFTAEEATWNAPKAVVLSHGYWARRFAADPGVVGRAITIDDEPATVVGVLPETFDFATVFAPGRRVDFFSPFPLSPETNRRGNTLALVGRLRPGAAPEVAQTEAAMLAARIERAQALNEFAPRVSALREHISGRFRPAMVLLASAVGLVMMIVCANLSNLLLARAASRNREMAVRAALGASRRRLIRQLLTESVVLSCGGAALGLLLAVCGTHLVSRLDTTVPLLEHVRVDGVALGFTLLAAVATGIAFGLTPALRASAVDLNSALRAGGPGASEGRGHGSVRRALVVAEVGLACMLLVGAGLLLRSLARVLEVDLGFRPQNVVAVRIDPSAPFETAALQDAHYAEVLRRLGSAPGVDAAGLSDVLPFGHNRLWSAPAKGKAYARDETPQAYVRVVSEGYLRAMGVELRAGRDFSPGDGRSGRPVVIVNETLARTLWPGEDPLGRIVGGGDGLEREVVGVVQGTRHQALEQESGAEMYIPMRQTSDYSQVHVVARGARSAATLVAGVRGALGPMDSRIALNEVRSLPDLVDRSLAPRRLLVTVVGGFAAFALMLAALGIYGVISYSMSQRRKEFGIRLALGASPDRLRRRVVAETLGLASAGIVLGLAGSWPLARVLEGLLFEIPAADPVTFLTIPVALIAVAAVAGYLPARRVSRLNPVEALRAE